MRQFVEEEARATQTPLALPAMLALAVCAASCAKKVVALVREGYTEPLNIFTVVTLPPGNRKSSVFRDVVAPLEEYEREEIRNTKGEIAAANTRYKILEAKLERVRTEAARAKEADRSHLESEAEELSRQLTETEVPAHPRYVADDCSPERLATLLRDQGGRLAVLSPEGDIFDMMAGRYSPNGTPNLGVYLKGHAGDTLRVDRVNRPPEFVEAPALTLAVAVQPEVLRGLASRPGFRGRGLTGRILYALPKSTLGTRQVAPRPVPLVVRSGYENAVRSLLQLPFGTDRTGARCHHVLSLTSDASETLVKFEQWVEPQLSEFGELGHLSDWGGKLVGHTVRIAGILHMIGHSSRPDPWATPISRETVLRAWEIADFLIAHARAAYGEMGTDPGVESARIVLGWIERRGGTSFNRRDLFKGLRGRFKRVSELEGPLTLLVEQGYIRPQPTVEQSGPGRPASPIYDVNPWLSTHNLQNPQNAGREVNCGDSGDFVQEQSAPRAPSNPAPSSTAAAENFHG